MIDLDKLERLAKAATPGPWRVESEVVRDSMGLFWPISSIEGTEDNVAENVTTGDAAYIVEACNAVPELIAENRALREKVRELEERAQKAEDRLGDCRLMQTAYMRTISDLKAELFKRSPSVDFPKLRKSVEQIDNSLSVFLEDSIKRAASRP